MSLFGGLVAGAMVGGGGALQQVARDRAQSEERQRLMELESKMQEQREVRLNEMRAATQEKQTRLQHELGEQSALNRVKGPYADAALDLSGRQAQQTLDIANKPENRAAAIQAARDLDAAKLRELPPGTQLQDGTGRVVGENKRITSAEMYDNAYGKGLIGKKGGGASGGGADKPEKMDQVDVQELTGVRQEQRELRQTIRALQKDPLADKTLLSGAQEELRAAMGREQGILKRYGRGPEEAAPGAAGAAPELPKPSEKAVNLLRENASDPAAIAQFERTFGRGSAAGLLKDNKSAPGDQRGNDTQPKVEKEAPKSVFGGAVDTAKGLIGDTVNKFTKPDDQRLGAPRDVRLTDAERRQQSDADADRQRPKTAGRDVQLSERERQQQREYDESRKADDERRATSARVEQEKAADIARIPKMSPEEKREMFDKWGTRLPVRIRRQLLQDMDR